MRVSAKDYHAMGARNTPKNENSLPPPTRDPGYRDRALVRRAQLGEYPAFNALVRRYRPRIMQLAMRYTRNRDDAEDVVQNTFLRAFVALKQFRGDSAFYSWIHRIAINAAKSALCARRRDVSVICPGAVDGAELEDGAGVRHELDTPEEVALTDEIYRVVNTAIAELGEEQRGAIVLRELEGLSYAEVALEMSCPIGTVRSRVFRAREAIDIRLRQVFDNGLSRVKRASDHYLRISSTYCEMNDTPHCSSLVKGPGS